MWYLVDTSRLFTVMPLESFSFEFSGSYANFEIRRLSFSIGRSKKTVSPQKLPIMHADTQTCLLGLFLLLTNRVMCWCHCFRRRTPEVSRVHMRQTWKVGQFPTAKHHPHGCLPHVVHEGHSQSETAHLCLFSPGVCQIPAEFRLWCVTFAIIPSVDDTGAFF